MSARLLGMGFACDMGTPHRKLVLLKLIDACEDDGSRIFPAVATIARAAQCSARQVQRELAKMVDIGLLRIVREGGKGPRSTREYALDVGFLRRIEDAGWEAICAGAADGAKGDPESPLEGAAKGDSDDTERVTGATDKGDRLSHPTPPEPSIDPSQRESARESDGQETEPVSAEPDDAAGDDRPDSAGFQKRLARFCSGRGFVAGPWPDWDTASLGWIGRQFAALSPADREAAERWRDPYLLDIRDRKAKPMPVGVFLRDRAWEALDPMVLKRADARQAAKLKPDERAKPDGWAACLGPVGMAWLFTVLLDGPADAAAWEQNYNPAGFYLDAKLNNGWKQVGWWRAVLRQSGGAVFPDRWHALKDAMEPVPAGTDVLAAWKAEFERRQWPWLAALDKGDVVYCPKGGVDGLGAFEEAVSRTAANGDKGKALARIGAETEGKSGDDDGQRQAAE